MTLDTALSCDVTTDDYVIAHTITGSSRTDEADFHELRRRLCRPYAKQLPIPELAYLIASALAAGCEVDASSVRPRLEPFIATSLSECRYTGPSAAAEDMLEYDIVLSMPPPRRHSVFLELKSVKPAAARIVEPEDI